MSRGRPGSGSSFQKAPLADARRFQVELQLLTVALEGDDDSNTDESALCLALPRRSCASSVAPRQVFFLSFFFLFFLFFYLSLSLFLSFLKILFIFRERGKEGERERENHTTRERHSHSCVSDTVTGCLSCAPYWGPGLQPRPVP